MRNPLAAGELALATVLLIGAGLLMQSLLRLQQVHLGFQPQGLLTFQIAPPPARYPGVKAWTFYREMLDSLEALSRVRGAAVSSGLPFGAGNYTTTPTRTTSKSALPAGAALPSGLAGCEPRIFPRHADSAPARPLLHGSRHTLCPACDHRQPGDRHQILGR